MTDFVLFSDDAEIIACVHALRADEGLVVTCGRSLADALSILEKPGNFEIYLIDQLFCERIGLDLAGEVKRVRSDAGVILLNPTPARSLINIDDVMGPPYESREVRYRIERLVERLEFERDRQDLATKGGIYDLITGLGNRALFLENLRQMVRLTRRNSQIGFAVIVVEIMSEPPPQLRKSRELEENFLVAIADRLRNCCRVSDSLARLSRDEFAIIMQDDGADKNISVFTGRIAASLREPVLIAGEKISTQVGFHVAQGGLGRHPSKDMNPAAAALRAVEAFLSEHRDQR